jgi:hypothetical protein
MILGWVQAPQMGYGGGRWRVTRRDRLSEGRTEMTERIFLRHPVKDETVEVRTGFSWAACLLGFVWALMKRMWLVALLLLAADLAIGLIGFAGVTADVISLLLSIVFAAYCGMRGNQWYRRDLERKGYVVLSQT